MTYKQILEEVKRRFEAYIDNPSPEACIIIEEGTAKWIGGLVKEESEWILELIAQSDAPLLFKKRLVDKIRRRVNYE